MKKTVKKIIAVASAVAIFASVGGGLVACNGDAPSPYPDPRPSVVDSEGKLKTATYNTYASAMPSNWNELSYQDNTDTLILNYIVSSFFEFDYKFEESLGGKFTEDGFVNKDAIADYEAVDIKYSAATALEDVTSTVDAKWAYSDEQKASGGYAWKVTIRDDIKWDDGTPIDASDFVYSMKEMLNPDFLNVRANTYYERFGVLNADYYIFSKQDYLFESFAAHDYSTFDAAVAAGADIWVDGDELFGMNGALKLSAFNPDATSYSEVFVVDTTASPIDTYMPYNEDIYLDPAIEDYVDGDVIDFEALAADEASVGDFVVSGVDIVDMYKGAYGPDAFDDGGMLGDYVKIRVLNEHTEVGWEDVGFYQDGKYSFVVCMSKPIHCLNDDGTLSYHAAYEFQSWPLVKQDLYESCKKEPATGSNLWTSNYNSTLATTASWGPYKLTAFQGGKSFTLERNDNWFGYGLEDNKNQYNITKIQCERISEPSTAWMSFLSGNLDAISVDKDHLEYRDSYYSSTSVDSGTFGLQVYSNLAVLNGNGRNNGILAIDNFRQALSLSINRNDVVDKIWPVSAVPCYGVMNDVYTYDVSDMSSYRKSVQGKTALLNAYGFTQGADGKWSDGIGITNATLDDAYDALTGYNPTLAKELLLEAYEELTTDPKYGYDSTKDIEIVYGASVDNDLSQFRCQYVQDVINTLTAGTPLEGKIKLRLDASQGSSGWADAFKNDTYDFFFGAGFTGNALDPFDMIGGFVDPTDSLNYHKYWDTTKENLTIKLPAGDYTQAGQTLTMTIKNWYDCLNGNAVRNNDTYKYDWSAGSDATAEARLVILSSIETAVLQKNYFIALIGESNTDLLGAKFSNFTDEYSLFNGFGGMRYLNVHYTDAEWDAYVSSKGGSLESEYKKTGD